MIAIEKNSYENYFQILDSFGKSMHMYNLDYKNSRLIPIDLNDFLSDIKNNLPNKYTQDNKWAKDILFTKIKINWNY